jgi:hypothetical protein
MNHLITIWAFIYVIGLAVFYLLVLFIIPAGYKYLRQLFRDLRKSNEGDRKPTP